MNKSLHPPRRPAPLQPKQSRGFVSPSFRQAEASTDPASGDLSGSALLSAVLNATSAGIVLLDRDLRYTAFNHAHATTMLARYKVLPTLGSSMLAAISDDTERAALLSRLNRCLAGESFSETLFTRGDGASEPDLGITYGPTRDDGGLVTGVTIVVKDVTAMGHTLRALLDSEATWRQIVEASPEVHMLLDAEGHLLGCNEAAVQQLGLSREALATASAHNVFPPELATSRLAHFASVCSTGMPLTFEDEVSGRWFEHRLYPITDPDGRVIRVSMQATDITDRKREQQRALSNEARMTTLLKLSRMDFRNEGEIVQFALEESLKLTDSTIGYFHFYDPATEKLTLFRWSSSVAQFCSIPQVPTEYPLASAGIWADCVRDGAPVVHNDYRSRPDKTGYPAGHCSIERHLSVPVFDRGGIVAVACVANKATPYDELDVLQLQVFMDGVWHAVRRSRHEAQVRMLSRVVEQSPASIVITDRNGLIEYVNPKFTSLTGYELSEVIGQNPRVLKSGEVQEGTYADLWGAILAGGVWKGEFHNRKKNGELYWESASISPVTDGDGTIAHFLAVKEDITSLKQAQASLRSRQATLQAITESSQEAIVMIDDAGDIVFWNPAATRMMGYTAQEAIGSNLRRMLGPKQYVDDHVASFPPLTSSGEQGSVGRTLELTAIRKDGTELPVSLSISEVQLEARWHAVGVLRDISELKRSERRLARITECLLQFGRDFDANIQKVLDVTANLLGASLVTYVRRDAGLLRVRGRSGDMGLSRGNMIERCAALRLAFETTEQQPIALRMAGGASHCGDPPPPNCPFLACVAQPIRCGGDQVGVVSAHFTGRFEPTDDDAKVLEIVSVALGTEEDRMRADAERKSAELQRMHAGKMESVGRLAAGIAHEINTPTQFVGDNLHFLGDALGTILSTIRAYRAGGAAATDEQVDDEEVDYLLAEIPGALQQSLEGIERVTRIVRAMKDFSHPGSSEKSPVDLNHAVETTVTVARNEWKYVADVRTELAPSLPLVPCLEGEIKQVILNLVVNAAHAIAEKQAASKDFEAKGLITLTTRSTAHHAEIEVADSGIGIPHENLARIFEPFFTTKEVGKGTGQGLAIAYDVIVTQHGGTISCESKPGQGTTFAIHLPLSRTPPPRLAAEAHAVNAAVSEPG